MKSLVSFFISSAKTALSGTKSYYAWLGLLVFGMIIGGYGYSIQFREGLQVTGMSDHVSWGFYISNFTFLVGVAAAAVMLVLPAYILKDVDFNKAVLLGEGLAVAALIMCLGFVTVDIGNPMKIWHMMPVVGQFNWPQSMLAWDVIVLNGYLALNALIPFYLLYTRYIGKKPNANLYIPFVYLSVIWAVGIHLVTAFLYAGLPARPFWNSSLMGPRFLASAFAGGPALIIIILYFFKRRKIYEVSDMLLHKLGLIVAIAAQVNLIMLASELFKEFYWPTEHSHSAMYMFLGLDGHNALSPTIWAAIACNVLVTGLLMINKLRWKLSVLVPCCVVLFCAIWVEKGMGLVVPGFIPSPLGEIVEYAPTYVELMVSFGIVCGGCLVFTMLAKPAIAIEKGELKRDTSGN